MALPTSGVHECRLSVTNSGATVPVCTCSWVGSVHPRQWRTITKSGNRVADPDATARNASAEWRRHFQVAHVPLVPFDPATVAHTVRPPAGRFGHS